MPIRAIGHLDRGGALAWSVMLCGANAARPWGTGKRARGTRVMTYPPQEAPRSPVVSTDGTILPRHLAAIVDNFAAIILGFLALQAVDNELRWAQVTILVAVYILYYFLSEGLVSRTPGKLLTGLVVVQFDGQRCSWRQTLIRTSFRILEVNPLLFGAVPAALCIVFSKHRQRLGDIVADTIVVPSSRLPRRRRRLEKRGAAESPPSIEQSTSK